MVKKSVKKHSHTHNENKNHIHIHIGDKKRKNKGRRRQGRGGGGGGVVSVNSVVHPPNIVIPQYNKPQYLDPSTMAGRENASHFAFPIPTIKHPPTAGFTSQVPETGVRATEFSNHTPHTTPSKTDFVNQTPYTGESSLIKELKTKLEKRSEKRENENMSAEDKNTHPDERFGRNPLHNRGRGRPKNTERTQEQIDATNAKRRKNASLKGGIPEWLNK